MYLALSGIAQLLAVLFLAISMVALLLLCALRSSKRLHEDVSGSFVLGPPMEGFTNFEFYVDVELVDPRASIVLRTNPDRKVRVCPVSLGENLNSSLSLES